MVRFDFGSRALSSKMFVFLFLVSSLVACGENGGLYRTAERYDEERQCWEDASGERIQAGVHLGCDDAFTYAKHRRTGEYWMFRNGCLPIGYAETSDLPDPAWSAPTCGGMERW